MKKLFLSLAAFSTIVACSSSNDDEPRTNNASIVGKWYINKAEKYTSANKQTEVHVFSECEKKGTHEFREKDMTSTTFAPENNNCVQTDVVTRRYTFDLESKKFWYDDDKDFPYTISQLTQTDMVFEDHLADVDGDGIKDVIKFYFKRIK
ncbi:hypothetical protein EG344_06410 [Chryseobacterium sp. G0162]|uniref:lipocalin family protein n=1 Tax=Chryseobacterium sp. G0162 TaxID=2487063 RepID=UPI000F4E4CE4|nr:lipocalin family protein [Chryseobacterium sp. G0162]AZB08504.1 hypothetical protein EG344_06410 [Chryseobacterium sp. G0162]